MPAEYTRIFLVDDQSGKSGFMEHGTAEYNNHLFLILQGDGGRQWLECSYIDKSIKPLGTIRVVIPEGPGHENALLDACIAFAPEFFKSCESLNKVMSNLPDTDILEVDRPEFWETLREEAREIFEKKIRMMEYPIPGKLLDSNGKYNGN